MTIDYSKFSALNIVNEVRSTNNELEILCNFVQAIKDNTGIANAYNIDIIENRINELNNPIM